MMKVKVMLGCGVIMQIVMKGSQQVESSEG